MHSPKTLAASCIDQLLLHLPAVRDGDPEAVHQARVATRRLRELAPLLIPSSNREAEEWAQLVRHAGRQLGRVRELDVMHETLMAQEGRIPAVAAVAAVARRTLMQQRQRARRRMIKALERLDVERLGGALPSLRPRWGDVVHRYTPGRWADVLRERLHHLAAALRDAVHHASGVYFPNRSHRTRVAVKKLRYAVEVAGATGLWNPPHVLQDLRRVQATLGRLHDLQVLTDRIEALVDDDSVRPQVGALIGALRGEAAVEFASYRDRRDRLLAICDVCSRFAFAGRRDGSLRRPLMVVSAVAVPAGVLLLGAHQRQPA